MIQVVNGRIVGTGAAINTVLGFTPAVVELKCSESSAKGQWNSTMPAGTFMAEYVNELRASDILLGSSLPFIGSTDTELANRRLTVQFNAAGDVREECTADLTGTAFTATDHDINAALWASYMLCVTTGSARTIIRSGGVHPGVLGYATEALAIAAMFVTGKTADSAILGYCTIKATAGAIFNATTDALAGGASGAPAAITNYYRGYAVMENGITVFGTGLADTYKGFRIGTDALINVLGSDIYYKAYRS